MAKTILSKGKVTKSVIPILIIAGLVFAQVTKICYADIPAELEQAKEKLMGQFLGRLTKDRSVPRQHVQATRRKIDEIIRNARGMEDLEYMLWREEYAKQLLELGQGTYCMIWKDIGFPLLVPHVARPSQ